MDNIELEKKRLSYNKKYRELFGYIPCRLDFMCSNSEFYDALVSSVEQEAEITKFLKTRKLKPGQPTNI